MTTETKQDRKQELIKKITAFEKERLYAKELLPELLLLQQQIVDLTFNGEHANNAGLRIHNVLEHLEALNESKWRKLKFSTFLLFARHGRALMGESP